MLHNGNGLHIPPCIALLELLFCTRQMQPRCLPVQGRSGACRPAWRTSALANAADRPTSPANVPAWARRAFLEEVGKPEARINMAKACLLISLEEEAAFQDSVGDSTSGERWLELRGSADGEHAAFALSNRCPVARPCLLLAVIPIWCPLWLPRSVNTGHASNGGVEVSAWEYIGMQGREWPPQAATREICLAHPRCPQSEVPEPPRGPNMHKAPARTTSFLLTLAKRPV